LGEKSRRVFRKRGKPAIYAMIKQQSAFHSVQRLCRAFSLSSSGYYRWVKCPVGKRQREDQELSWQDAAPPFDEKIKSETQGGPTF
jgi:hypothetical protein